MNEYKNSRDFVRSHFNTCAEDQEQTLIITPELLFQQSQRLPDVFNCKVIFAGFHTSDSLSLHGRVFNDDVYISESVILDLDECKFEKKLAFSACDFSNLKALPEIAEVLILDETSYDRYRKMRVKKRITGNQSVLLQDREAIRKLVTDEYRAAKPLAINEYLDALSIKYVMIDGTYSVEDDLLLQGPYPFDFSLIAEIKGSLTIIDDADYYLPDDCEILGSVDIKGYL